MRKIIIVGMAGPYEKDLEPGEEIWGVNRTYQHQKNLSRLYFLDHIDAFHDDFVKEINDLDIDIFCQEKHPRIKFSMPYPLEEIRQRFPFSFFTSSISYMIADAIRQEVDHIHLHKILPEPLHGEYQDQKGCIEFWTGIAIGAGIDVTKFDSSVAAPLPWQTGLYGYINAKPFAKVFYQAGFRKEA